ncbi:MAG TPA: TldD/PmbA family protein [Firmicutes bacterium]|nr:TldD/PmbA family protein [Candidatus Fermentithermobacillaceae bacterium]
MNDPTRSAEYGVNALLKAGADRAQCHVTRIEKHELNVMSGEMSLLRTTFDTQVKLIAIKDGKKGSTTINKSDPDSVVKGAREALAIAEAAVPDEANDIAEGQPAARFVSGSESPDRDNMHYRMKELLETARERYPALLMLQAFLDFTREDTYVVNSNGVDFSAVKGVYHCTAVFSAKEDGKVSSFNGTSVAMRDLGVPIIECGSTGRLMRETTEQIHTRPVPGKFTGDVIIAPDCLGDMLAFLDDSIRDRALISGTSVYKDSLNQLIASPLLSLHARPVSGEICDGYFITSDGYSAQNSTIVDRGFLRTFLLSLYGSRKTGRTRAVNDGGAYVVDPGETPLDEMVKSVDRGVLLVRFSGGYPNENGDFSGVAKNSYFIENGQVKYPISETMISGNLAECYKNIRAVSRECVNYGYAVFPWVAVSGVTISGK